MKLALSAELGVLSHMSVFDIFLLAVFVSLCRLDLGSMLQGRLSARANTAADMDTNKLSYMVRDT